LPASRYRTDRSARLATLTCMIPRYLRPAGIVYDLCVKRLGLIVLVLVASVACQPSSDASPAADGTVPAPRDVAAPPADALRTPSGLASKMLRVGLGRQHPSPRSQVLVNYTGWTPDGHMFDSSVRSGGGPVVIALDQVMPGWTEGLQLMVPGEKRR